MSMEQHFDQPPADPAPEAQEPAQAEKEEVNPDQLPEQLDQKFLNNIAAGLETLAGDITRLGRLGDRHILNPEWLGEVIHLGRKFQSFDPRNSDPDDIAQTFSQLTDRMSDKPRVFLGRNAGPPSADDWDEFGHHMKNISSTTIQIINVLARIDDPDGWNKANRNARRLIEEGMNTMKSSINRFRG